MSESILLRTYPDRLHAELARSFLESEGIDAFVTSPSSMPGSFLIAEWGDGMIPHELKVAKEDLTAAQDALAETEISDDQELAWQDESEISAADEEPLPQSTERAPSGHDTPDSNMCGTCQGPLTGDDPWFGTLRRVLFLGLLVYATLSIATLFLSRQITGLFVPILAFLMFAFLVYRGYLLRHRCGQCGHCRTAKVTTSV